MLVCLLAPPRARFTNQFHLRDKIWNEMKSSLSQSLTAEKLCVHQERTVSQHSTRSLLEYSARARWKQNNKVLRTATSSTQTTLQFRFRHCDGVSGVGVCFGEMTR